MNSRRRKLLHDQLGGIHPLVATAAVAVTLVSLVGIAAITGVLPTSQSTPTPIPAVAMAPSNELVQNTPPANMSATTPPPAQNYPAAPAYLAPPASPPAPVSPPALPRPKPIAPPAAASNHRYAPAYAAYPPPQPVQVAQAPAICHACGRVESIVAINQPAQPSGLGIAAGAVVGGLLGNHVGGGNGRTLATVAGAVAGGYGGNEVEKRSRSTVNYQVRVRMEDGEIRTFPQSGQEGWRVGDRVRVINGALTSRG